MSREKAQELKSLRSSEQRLGLVWLVFVMLAWFSADRRRGFAGSGDQGCIVMGLERFGGSGWACGVVAGSGAEGSSCGEDRPMTERSLRPAVRWWRRMSQ